MVSSASRRRRGGGAAQGQRLARGADEDGGERVERALRLGIEGADRLDLVAEELDANGARQRGREDVDDAAAMADVAGLLDLRHVLVAQAEQVLEQDARVELEAVAKLDDGFGELVGRHDRLREGAVGADDDHRAGGRAKRGEDVHA